MEEFKLPDTARRFLDHLSVERGHSKNTILSYRRDLIGYFTHHEVFNEELVGAFFLDLQRSGLSESSLARKISVFRSYSNFLYREYKTPLLEIALQLRPSKNLPKALPVERIISIIEGCQETEIGLRDRAILEILYGTGIRVSEAVGLNLIDLKGRLNNGEDISFIEVTGKGSKLRYVPFGKHAEKAVENYLVRARPSLATSTTEGALFLNSRGQRISRQSIWQIVHDAALRAKVLDEVSPHSFRHSFATHLLEGGADIRVVQELLGHASVTTTQIYTLITIDALRETFAQSHPRAR
jgi:integrase/recombinase XerD